MKINPVNLRIYQTVGPWKSGKIRTDSFKEVLTDAKSHLDLRGVLSQEERDMLAALFNFSDEGSSVASYGPHGAVMTGQGGVGLHVDTRG